MSFRKRSKLSPGRAQPDPAQMMRERARASAAHHGALALGPEDALLDSFRPRLLQRALLLRSHPGLFCRARSAQARPSKRQSQRLHGMSHTFTGEPRPQHTALIPVCSTAKAGNPDTSLGAYTSIRISHDGT